MNTKITLTNPTDDELSAAVAEHVAKYKNVICVMHPPCLAVDNPCVPGVRIRIPLFATSADAVLPLLEKALYWYATYVSKNGKHEVYVNEMRKCVVNCADYGANSPTFARAACIALLRANGVEVIT